LDFDYNRGIKNVILCPNFIDTKTLPPQRPWNERQERGAFVGRLMPFKNVFNMVEACAKAGMPLDVYGDGPLRQDMEEHAKKVGAEVVFKGIRPNDEIREALPNYKYHFLVSNYEGMPKALLEGMAAGALCIVSPIYGCTEIIDHEVNGIIAPGLDVDSLVEAIEQARRSEGQVLGDNAVDKIQRQYSLDRVVDLHQKALFSDNQVA
jgi:glycosyltransferase involved in cell wall biosynthesis